MAAMINPTESVNWEHTSAEKRERLLLFRNMLCNCLHPSVSMQATFKILQTLQAASEFAGLHHTPLFADAADLLSIKKDKKFDAFQAKDRIKSPVTEGFDDIIFVNTLPWQDAKPNAYIICTSARNFIQIARELSEEEQKNICLADTAVSPVFLRLPGQRDLFSPLPAANEQLARKAAARRYDAVAAELPLKKELSATVYGNKNFWVVWMESLTKLLNPDGIIYLKSDENFFITNKFVSLRNFLAIRFDYIGVYQSNNHCIILLHQRKKERKFYSENSAYADNLIITKENIWLSGSEQTFFEGMPLGKALIVPFKVSELENRMIIRFETPFENPAEAVSDAVADYLKAHYRFEERHKQERAALAEYARELTDVDDLQYCRIQPELAQELRRWVQWAESKETDKFLKKIYNPDFLLAKQFATTARLFAEIYKKFEKFGQKAALDKESQWLIEQWFEKKSNALTSINEFFSRPNFDAPPYEIDKTDVFYYIFALIQSESYFYQFRRLLRYFEPRVYPTEDFRERVETGKNLWKTARENL